MTAKIHTGKTLITQIHNYHICKFSKCHEICLEDEIAMTKDKKF